MVTGKTTSGFSYGVPKRRFSNMRLVDALVELETNGLALSRVVRLLMGQEGQEKLYAHLEDEEGIVDTVQVQKAVTEIMEAYGKKS